MPLHSAPAVSFPVGRSRFYGWVIALTITLSAFTLVLWVAWADALAIRHAGAALLWLCSAAWAVVAWQHSPVGTLAWDGQVWIWRCGDDGLPVDVTASVDSQSALLLRLSAHRQHVVWVWPERRMAPQHWLALRRAVFAPKSSVPRQVDLGVTP